MTDVGDAFERFAKAVAPACVDPALPMPFGKYRDRSLSWIAEHDRDYLRWACGKLHDRTLRRTAQELLVETE